VNKRLHKRLVSAREKLVELRTRRFEQLALFRMFLKVALNDYLTSIDPITGQRFASLTFEANKVQGEAALRLTMLDGSTLHIALNRAGHFAMTAEPDLFEGVKITDLLVKDNLSSADFICLVNDATNAQTYRFDAGKLIEALVARVIDYSEAEAVTALPPLTDEAQTPAAVAALAEAEAAAPAPMEKPAARVERGSVVQFSLR
jgi:hypothetical protein